MPQSARPVATFGFRPVVDIVEQGVQAHSHYGADVYLSEVSSVLPSFSRQLDALLARGATEAEIASLRAQAERVEAVEAADRFPSLHPGN
jgi:hypothetical protein